MAGRAAFAHGFMLENKRLRLFAMALGTGFVQARHGQAARGFENVAAVRVMALHAVHATFEHRVMLRQVEFRLRLQMALKAGSRVLAGIDDEPAAPATGLNVQTAWPVAGFATALAFELVPFDVQPRVRAGRKSTHVVRVAIEADAVANIRGPGNFRRREHGLRDRGTRNGNGDNQTRHQCERNATLVPMAKGPRSRRQGSQHKVGHAVGVSTNAEMLREAGMVSSRHWVRL